MVESGPILGISMYCCLATLVVRMFKNLDEPGVLRMSCVPVTDDDVDGVLLTHLANLSAYVDIYHHLENSLKTGRISLAKTRCNSLCGPAKISRISYNSAEMASHGATARVQVDNSSFDLVDKLSPLDNCVGGAESTGASTECKVPDPINWFCGVLVPPQLRLAQVSFRRSLRLINELANRRAALLRSTKQLSDLIEARDRLDNESLILLNSKPAQPSQATH